MPAAIIFGAATLQGLFILSNLAFLKKGSRTANWILAGLVLSITLIIFQNFVILGGYYTEFPNLIFLFFPLNGLVAQLYYMYVVFLIYPERGFKWHDILHLQLFFMLLAGHIGFLVQPADVKIMGAEYFYFSDKEFNGVDLPKLIFRKVVFLLYAIAVLRLLNNKLEDLKKWSSDTNIQYLNRFRFISHVFLVWTITALIGPVYSYTFEVTIGLYEVYHHVLNSLLIMGLAIITMQQPERLLFTLKTKTKKVDSKLSHKLALEGLQNLMERDKPFLKPDFQLYDLAKLADTPPHILSDQINKELGINFYEFVNGYRVEEFKKRVSSRDYKNLTLLAIAYDVGFNSKASFNRIFKKHTSLTPSQFSKIEVSTSHDEAKSA